jgi:hypothetical protein
MEFVKVSQIDENIMDAHTAEPASVTRPSGSFVQRCMGDQSKHFGEPLGGVCTSTTNLPFPQATMSHPPFKTNRITLFVDCVIEDLRLLWCAQVPVRITMFINVVDFMKLSARC